MPWCRGAPPPSSRDRGGTAARGRCGRAPRTAVRLPPRKAEGDAMGRIATPSTCGPFPSAARRVGGGTAGWPGPLRGRPGVGQARRERGALPGPPTASSSSGGGAAWRAAALPPPIRMAEPARRRQAPPPVARPRLHAPRARRAGGEARTAAPNASAARLRRPSSGRRRGSLVARPAREVPSRIMALLRRTASARGRKWRATAMMKVLAGLPAACQRSPVAAGRGDGEGRADPAPASPDVAGDAPRAAIAGIGRAAGG